MQPEAAARSPALSSGLGGRRVAEAALLLAWPLAAMALLEYFHAGMLASIVVFLLAPAAVLAWARPGIVVPGLTFALLVGAPSIGWIDELGTRNGQWAIVDPLSVALPLVGFSLQSLLWAVAHFFSSVVAWEHIKGSAAVYSPRLSRVALGAAAAWGLLALFLALKAWRPAALDLPYFYCVFGLTLIFGPVAAACLLRPQLARPLAILAVVGVWWKACYEIAALRNDWWEFPGTFIGWVNLFGYPVPLEELIFWLILFSPAIAVFWEFWIGPATAASGSRRGRRGTAA